jgi:uncharacterized protein
MMLRLIVAALVCGATLAQAQSPSKKELVQKFLLLQQPGLESVARGLVEQPAAQMMQAAGRALQTDVPADKRETVAKAIEADVKKYVDEALPLVRERALGAAPLTIGAMLEEKFSEDELKQLITWFESPVNKKYQQLSAEMQKGFVEKVVADSRPLIEPKIQALEQKVRASLGVPAAAKSAAPVKGAGAAAKPAGPAKAASGPAKASSP